GLLFAAGVGPGGAWGCSSGYGLAASAAVVWGGTFLVGGGGGVAGTLAGVLILAELDTVFNVLQVDPFFKEVLRGVVIIAAVAIYARRQVERRATRARFGGDGDDGGTGPGRAPDRPPDSTAGGADGDQVVAGHGGDR